jgi:hypothetical protein
MATVINVADEAQLRAAIFQASNDLAVDGVVDGGPYTINITANIALTESLPMIRTDLPSDGTTEIVFNGNGHTIDGNNLARVFFVVSGGVSVNDLTIANARARGATAAMRVHPAQGAGAVAASAQARRSSSTAKRLSP